MKNKKTGFALLVGFMVLNMFWIASVAKADDQHWISLPGAPGKNVWKNKTKFSFSSAQLSVQSPAYKFDSRLNEDEVRSRPEMAGGMLPQAIQLVEKIPYVRSVVAMKEKYMNQLDSKLDNPGGRLFSPIMNKQNNQERMPGQKAAGQNPDEKNGFDDRFSGKEAQERYFVGYRLNPLHRQEEETWYLGFGWKSGNGSKNRKDLADREGKNTLQNESTGLSDSDKDVSSVKVGYSGPILALVGQF